MIPRWPRRIRGDADARRYYADLLARLGEAGTLDLRLRPTSLQNVLAFFVRILGPQPGATTWDPPTPATMTRTWLLPRVGRSDRPNRTDRRPTVER